MIRKGIVGCALSQDGQVSRREVYNGIDGRGFAMLEAGRAQNVEDGGPQQTEEEIVLGHACTCVGDG